MALSEIHLFHGCIHLRFNTSLLIEVFRFWHVLHETSLFLFQDDEDDDEEDEDETGEQDMQEDADSDDDMQDDDSDDLQEEEEEDKEEYEEVSHFWGVLDGGF